ncbi:MAG: hypothetical protein ACREBV_04230 [Candidatus Zixiibacteriota bacterium]
MERSGKKDLQPAARPYMSGDPLPPKCAVISVHLRDIRQLFDSMDPSPFHEKDLDPDAEVYIVGSALELSSKASLALVVNLGHEAEIPDEGNVIGNAIRTHFERLASQNARELSQFLRRGRLTLLIGLLFLTSAVAGGAYVKELIGERPLSALIQEGLLIGGWVAMWKPLEIILYEWWPILSKRRLYERMSRMSVQIIYDVSRT